jgi:hypothetical protein
LNYDESGRTDAITSGCTNEVKTYIQYRYYEYPCKDKKIEAIIQAVKELELLFNNKYIDVEFAVTGDGSVYILQARPIITAGKNQSRPDLTGGLYKIYRKIEKLQRPHPDLLGGKAIFGVMPDWNPAEIIGFKPQRLALSLYKELITDNIWACQRDNYGYRNLCSHPLMVSFMGIPFIDVRVDFNSFVPKSLDEKIARKLVEYYINKLCATPAYHDKVEFEIVYSCFSFDLPQQLGKLSNAGFTVHEIKAIENALLELTNNVINNDRSGNNVYQKDLLKMPIAEQKYNDIAASNLSIIDKIYWLLEYCKRYGTLPFSGIARSAFISIQFLNSFVNQNIITRREFDLFMNSLNTVAKKLNSDLVSLSKEDFLAVWGHIRPGTYDITSPRYDEAFERYFSKMPETVQKENEFQFSRKQYALIDENIRKYGLKTDAKNLVSFIKSAIENREYSKFVFTKPLSYTLVLIEQFAKRFGISREDAAFLDIALFKDMYSSLDYRDVSAILRENISFNKHIYEYTQAIKLPAVILGSDDIYGFSIEESEPNYITSGSIKTEIVLEHDIVAGNLEGKIIFIKSADPGYDFLFTKNIGGLVTQFGGANSHMTIRCAEIGLPAVIGAGEKNFSRWSTARILEINCLNRQVRIIA